MSRARVMAARGAQGERSGLGWETRDSCWTNPRRRSMIPIIEPRNARMGHHVIDIRPHGQLFCDGRQRQSVTQATTETRDEIKPLALLVNPTK
jgi:hypothetical protein